MRWYRIEFFKVNIGSAESRVAVVERQYTTYRRAIAAADKMLDHRPDCIGYTLTVCSNSQATALNTVQGRNVGTTHEKRSVNMNLYHLQCVSPFFIWCAIGLAGYIYGFLKGWWAL